MKMFNLFNWVQKLVGFFTFSMDGGDAPTNTTSTVTQNSLPAYAQPYFEELLKQVGKQSFTTDAAGNVTGVKTGENLPQQNVAGFTDLQNQAHRETAGLTTPGQFANASSGANYGMNTGFNAANAGLAQAFGYNPEAITSRDIGVGNFSPAAASYYMDPYQRQVTDAALNQSNRQFAQQGASTMGMAQRQGTFGGAREALLRAEAVKNQGLNNAQIAAQGGSAAFQNAQQQFNADTQRQLAAQQANQQSNLAAQQATQQGRQYAAGLGQQIGLAGLQSGLAGAQQLGQLGTAQSQANLNNIAAKSAAGQQQQALAQQQANTGYQNQMAKYYYPQQQMQFYSDILRGNANALGSSQVQYAPAPSIAQQAASLGLSGLGLSKALS